MSGMLLLRLPLFAIVLSAILRAFPSSAGTRTVINATAAALEKAKDKASIAATVNGMACGTWLSGSAASLTTNVMAGVYLEWPVAASALSTTKVRVSGLPAGLKFDAKKTRIYGAPTAASKAKKVKVTVTTARRNSQTFRIDVKTDPLPAWAVGTFTGPSYDGGRDAPAATTNGLVAVTIGANGKISAKQPVNGKSVRFAASWFDRYDASAAALHATLTAKVGKETVTNEMALSPQGVRDVDAASGVYAEDASVTNGHIVAERFDAWQYNWKVEPWTCIYKALDRATRTYCVMSDGSCVDANAAFARIGEDGVVGKVTLKFGAKGAATVSGQFAKLDADGEPFYKKGKLQTVRATASTRLVPASTNGAISVFVYLAPKGLQPHARCLEMPWFWQPIIFNPIDDPRMIHLLKPVIYLYPETNATCRVQLALNGELTCTYPEYGTYGWRDFIASPDGTLTFPDGCRYYCLYWEGATETKWDFSRGYCVKGSETASFLADVLLEMGLTFREANEFIIYWLPLMQDNPYNVISFQGANYANAAKLTVEPQPDSVLRVFMAWRPSDRLVDIPAPVIAPFTRKGFVVVEWGGSQVSE